MNFVGIILALLLERGLGHVPGWGEPRIFPKVVDFLRSSLRWPALWNSHLAPFLLVLPPAVLAGWLQDQLSHPITELAFSSTVLLLCLGPRDLADDIQRWADAKAADDEAAAERAWHSMMHGPQPDPSHRTVLGALFIQSHERLFGVLMWFFVLGPAGAVLYRLASRLPRILHYAQTDPAAPTVALHTSEALHGLLAWLPARATAALYGLAGSLDDALQIWRKLAIEPHEWRSHTWAILGEVPSASLRMEEPGGAVVLESLRASLDEVARMQFRALIVLLAFFAIFTTGSIV